MTVATTEAYQAIKEAYPDINWERFEDIDRSLNWELWHGPLSEGYWNEVEPLEHYKWSGFAQAQQDLIDVLEPLPYQMWYDADSGCVTSIDPRDDEANVDEDGLWIGGDWWCEIEPRKILCHTETYKQVF